MDSDSTPTPTPSAVDSQKTLPPSQVYFCAICDKPFINESSRHRHVNYCRRTQNSSRARARSCRACSLSKTKCSFQKRCSRCTRKGLECVYNDSSTTCRIQSSPAIAPASTAEIGEPLRDSHILPEATESAPIWPLSADHDLERFPNDVGGFENPLGWTEAQGMPQLASGSSSLPVVRYTELLAGQSSNDSAYHQFSGASQEGSGSMQEDNSSFEDVDLDRLDGGHRRAIVPWSAWTTTRDDHFPGLSIPATISTFATSGLLARLPMSNLVAQSNAGFIIQTLRSFPQMMLRRASFPPFIHPHWHPLPEPLANCMSIAQMFASRTTETTSFLWRMIRMEQRRLIDHIDESSKEGLLAAIQAYIIYIIMRVVDDHRQHADFDVQTLRSFQFLCERLEKLCGEPFCLDEQSNPASNWSEWIFAESRRRVACVWFLISRVVCVKTGIPCDTLERFRALPLPSVKCLWEANNRSFWASEHNASLMTQGARITFFGELIAAQRRACESSNARRLDTWISGTDNLGTLLTLATAMV